MRNPLVRPATDEAEQQRQRDARPTGAEVVVEGGERDAGQREHRSRDRSNPPASITNVRPIATTHRIAVLVRSAAGCPR
jgi:hypothetical protein